MEWDNTDGAGANRCVYPKAVVARNQGRHADSPLRPDRLPHYLTSVGSKLRFIHRIESLSQPRGWRLARLLG
jgi:hypothetical protein